MRNYVIIRGGLQNTHYSNPLYYYLNVDPSERLALSLVSESNWYKERESVKRKLSPSNSPTGSGSNKKVHVD